MEESKLRTHRRPSVGSGRPVHRSATTAAGSSHVIDLRAAKPNPAPAAATSLAKPKPGRPKLLRRPQVAPSQPTSPVAPVAQSVPAPRSQPSAAPLAPLPASIVEPSLSPRRFWPAFWRFLVLLVILGALVTGGFYLYINYYRG